MRLMKVRLALLLALIILAAAPTLVAAVNRPSEALGVAELNPQQIQGAAILVAPNQASINLLVFVTNLNANTIHGVEVLRNDVCGAAGFSLTGTLGPFASNATGQLNVVTSAALAAPIDQLGQQDIAVRIRDNVGATVRCANVYTNNPGGAGKHWW